MIFRHHSARIVYGMPKVLGLQLAILDTAEVVELTLLKKGNIPPHSLDIPVTFYIVSGEGILSIDGEASPVQSGDVATSPAGSMRELTQTGDADFKVLVVKGL